MHGQRYRLECDGPVSGGHEPVVMASDDRPSPELIEMWLWQHAGHRMRTRGVTWE